MQKFLIPLFACLIFGIPSVLHAQNPENIALPHGAKLIPQAPSSNTPDMMCNNAGTFTIGQFIGNSNDTQLPVIFLCANDSIEIVHGNDADLSGDPVPGTPAGIAYAFYDCLPTVMGDNLQNIITDGCLITVPPPTNGLYITSGVANGASTWFFNSGALITLFGSGQPTNIFYAPITVDALPTTYETANVGFPPGPCVNVNTGAAFEVVYLNPVNADGITVNNGNDCLGRFTVRGGYPEYDNAATYDIQIYLTSDPTVKALIHTQEAQWFHLAPIIFSVPQPGNYTIEIIDGKSCPHTFTMDMTACNPTDNVVITLPDTTAMPGATNFCIPVTVDNFEIISSSFSVNWDPNVLQYVGISNVNPILDPFTSTTLNDAFAANGQIGFLIYDIDVVGNVLTIPNDSVLFELCFDVVGQLATCTGLTVSNTPTSVAFEDEMGQNLAVTVDTGSVCVGFAPLDFTIDIIDTTCLGTASMVITATGGVSDFDITVNEFNTGVVFPGSISGIGSSFTITNNIGNFNNLTYTYEVCVTDDSNTMLCDTIDVFIPTLGSQISFVQTPTCNGLENGIIQAVVLVGGSPVANPGPQYTYAWSPNTVPNPTGPIQDGMIAGGVPSGNYTLIVTDTQRNCSAPIASGFLGQPLPISSDVVTVTQASCTGIANGSISYTVEGGTPNANGQYGFSWEDDNGQPVGAPGLNNPIVINNIPSGTYSVTIVDNNLCTFIDQVTVTDQKTVELNPGSVQVPVSCFGLSDGGATATVTELPTSFGSSYTFVWSPNVVGSMQTNLNLSSGYSNVPAGTYSVTATDVNGCSATTTVTVTQPNELVLDTLGIQGPGCGQANTGSINVVAIGGNGGPNYTYNWSNMGTTAGQSGLAVGTYTVTVTDINGCQDSLTFTLDPPAPPSLTVNPTLVRCGGDGALTVVAPTAVDFAWATIPSGLTFPDTNMISNLDGGTYVVTITDGFSCTAADTITLASVTPLSFADTTFVQPSCFGTANGILGVVVQDGQAPYVNYNWNPTQSITGPTIPNLQAGTYAVTVTDNVGCTLTGSFTLTQPPQIVNTISGLVDVSCFGLCDGGATITTNYASTPPTTGSFIYIWSDGLSTSAMRTDLCVGQHIVTAADPNNCSDTDTLVITGPPAVASSATSTTPASCFGVADGTATIVGTGGNGGPYSVLWSNGSTGATITGLAAGPYTATVTDANGCTGTVAGIAVSQPAQIVVTQDLLQTDNPKCFGDDNGQIAVVVTGGNGGQVQYQWTDDQGNILGSTPQLLEDIPAGTYNVVVTDSEGCTGSLNDITLNDPAPVLGDYETPDPLLCHGDETILNIATINGGSGGPYQFSLDYGALLDPGFPVSIGGGEHYLTYYDVNGCSFTDTIDILEPELIEVVFDPSTIEIELGDTTYQLKPLITGAAVDTFLWTPAEYLNTPNVLNPYVVTYESRTFNLVVFDQNGCSGEGSITVDIDPNRNVYVPNVFKPGVGGLNDHFNVYVGRGIEIVNFMRVYDRWGELMYARERFLPNNDNFADGWDGKFNGDYVNPGVFVYIIEVTFLDGTVLLYRGDVTVVR
ncbi:MAG: gliding motility-associated C-terminal domain-containing protein [Saprospiraceae bacterium]|nr:gliding motility-associated C-terminal domain-containing protein [Saprospiraceae bacterium]